MVIDTVNKLDKPCARYLNPGSNGERCSDCGWEWYYHAKYSVVMRPSKKENDMAKVDYSISEAEIVLRDQLKQIPDVYHQGLFKWLVERVRELENAPVTFLSRSPLSLFWQKVYLRLAQEHEPRNAALGADKAVAEYRSRLKAKKPVTGKKQPRLRTRGINR